MFAPAVIHWDVSPVIFRLGPLSIRWYGLLFGLGFLVGFYLMRRVFRREDKPEADLDILLIYLVLGTIIGARLGHILFYHPGYYLSHPLEIIMVQRGGLASHGGLIGVLGALYLYARSRPEQPLLWLIDRLAAPVALTGCFIRLGNLFNAEILGVPTDVPWAFVFARVDATPRHPAQLYEALAYLLIFALLLALYRRYGPQTPRGLLSGLFFTLVFTARFFIEFVKMQQAPFADALPLQMGQLLSLPAIALGVALLAYAWRQGALAPEPDGA